jgi:hypothetical protein
MSTDDGFYYDEPQLSRAERRKLLKLAKRAKVSKGTIEVYLDEKPNPYADAPKNVRELLEREKEADLARENLREGNPKHRYVRQGTSAKVQWWRQASSHIKQKRGGNKMSRRAMRKQTRLLAGKV